MTGHKFTPAAEQFLADQPNLILATIRKDGRPQLTPVWFVWRDGAFLISTIPSTAKWKNLSRDNRCSAIIDGADDPFPFVQVTGVAELSLEYDPLDTSYEIIRKYKTEEEFGPYVEALKGEGQRGIIRLVPEKIITRELD
jgi:PPOX class probable F420-dependent enzyme